MIINQERPLKCITFNSKCFAIYYISTLYNIYIYMIKDKVLTYLNGYR